MRGLLVSLMLVAVAVVAAPAAWGGQETDYSKVQIKATKVSGDIYMLEGAGRNIGASIGNPRMRKNGH
jgi:cyclase